MRILCGTIVDLVCDYYRTIIVDLLFSNLSQLKSSIFFLCIKYFIYCITLRSFVLFKYHMIIIYFDLRGRP